ncbi:threo-3-hydroxy-L-aspartate ammonia-lyase [Blastococcus sp. Marseille-P5729]|uniref:threo-3-hydroxy-L-aspartate ammonia-lyase n=1 Tax=Blastococcus sp. Marseille-P5729 TaxID=2086582 RepID=UPI000D111C7E|nr:threo-3-hydroxy-L-aspartate ammonia-lyase [Blastococcus sp. Marseille-P5729]
MQQLPITYDDVLAASYRIDEAVRRTPVLTSAELNDALDARIHFKCENLQRVGAFKLRGAYNAIAALTPQERAAGVIAYSSGNHAQAVAMAATLQGARSTIVMPHDAPPIKRAATERYGARVVEYDRYREDRIEIARGIAEREGGVTIPPYDHPDVIAGQGTVAKELIEQVGTLDVVIAPLGGGGLLSGTAVAAAALCPEAQVLGVEPEAGDDGRRSLAAGQIVRIDTPQTIADGAQTQFLGQYTFPILRRYVAEILTVPDASLVQAMRWFFETLKVVVEPTGALAAAAVRDGLVDVRGKRVGVIVSGGNVDLARYGRLLSG